MDVRAGVPSFVPNQPNCTSAISTTTSISYHLKEEWVGLLDLCSYGANDPASLEVPLGLPFKKELLRRAGSRHPPAAAFQPRPGTPSRALTLGGLRRRLSLPFPGVTSIPRLPNGLREHSKLESPTAPCLQGAP